MNKTLQQQYLDDFVECRHNPIKELKNESRREDQGKVNKQTRVVSKGIKKSKKRNKLLVGRNESSRRSTSER
jgi:hypothetical protein